MCVCVCVRVYVYVCMCVSRVEGFRTEEEAKEIKEILGQATPDSIIVQLRHMNNLAGHR